MQGEKLWESVVGSSFLKQWRGLVACLRVALLVLGCAPGAAAHVSDTSLLRIRLQNGLLQVDSNVDLLTLSRVVPLDANGDGLVQKAELLQAGSKLEHFFRAKLKVSIGKGAPFLGKFSAPEWQSPLEAAASGDLQNVHVNLHFEQRWPAGERVFRLDADVFEVFGLNHSIILAVVEGDSTQQAVLTLETPGVEYELSSPERLPSQTPAGGGLFQLGFAHILGGYDHLLFLLTILIAARGVRELLGIITAFTVAHSVTVAVAVLGWVHLPEKWVECAIALSVAWVAAENVWVGGHRKRWLQVLGFGLLHGLGFAGALQQMELPKEGLAWSLVLFNAGVEAGQLSVVAPVFPLVLMLRKTGHAAFTLRLLSGAALVIALAWFFQRALA